MNLSKVFNDLMKLNTYQSLKNHYLILMFYFMVIFITSTVGHTMNKENAIDFINKNKGFCYMTSFGGKIKLQALSMVCESQYRGWYHTIDLKHDPEPLLEANLEDFKKLIKKNIEYIKSL